MPDQSDFLAFYLGQIRRLQTTYANPAQQKDGDGVDHLFEVPLNLAALDIGFRHENYLEESDVEAFLPVAIPQRKNLISRILGR